MAGVAPGLAVLPFKRIVSVVIVIEVDILPPHFLVAAITG